MRAIDELPPCLLRCCVSGPIADFLSVIGYGVTARRNYDATIQTNSTPQLPNTCYSYQHGAAEPSRR